MNLRWKFKTICEVKDEKGLTTSPFSRTHFLVCFQVIVGHNWAPTAPNRGRMK